MKNSSKRAYQLVKDLTTVEQGTATTVQDRSGKCLTEEREIQIRWIEYCIEPYNHKASGDLSVLDCSQTDTEDDHPILRKEVEAASTIIEDREVNLSRQHPSRTGPSRWRGCNHRSHNNLQYDLPSSSTAAQGTGSEQQLDPERDVYSHPPSSTYFRKGS